MRTAQAPRVSVVVPVHNGGAFLSRCLSALFQSSYEKFEVIVVDDASTDASLDVAREFPCRVIALAERGGPALARNIGVARASGEIIFFTDADVAVTPGVIGQAAEFLDTHPEASGVIGAYTRETPVKNFVSAYKNLQHHFVHRRSEGAVAGFFTACGAIRRNAFVELGGFDESARDCALEDLELGMRLKRHGHTIILTPELQVTHLKHYTLLSLIYVEFWQRAVPYTMHLLRHRTLPDELSTQRDQRLSLIAAYLAVILAACAPLAASPALYLSGAFCLLLLCVLLNRRLFIFLSEERGVMFACAGMAMQLLSYLYSGVGLFVGVCRFAAESFSGQSRHASAQLGGAGETPKREPQEREPQENPYSRLADERILSLATFRPTEPPAQTVRLGFNENPLGASPLAVEAARAALSRISRYPDDDGRALKRALAAKTGLHEENFFLGSGASEILEIIARTFVCPGDEIIFASPSFPMYRSLAQPRGAGSVIVPLRDYKHDLPAMAEKISPRTKLIFITNPNNPTGTLVGRDEIEGFMRFVPEDVLVVFDEAYIDYVEPGAVDTLALLSRSIIAVRTFSKMMGLAGLRLGYAIADPRILQLLEKVRRPFNTNAIAQAAAIVALSDERHQELTRRIVADGKRFLYRRLNALGINYVPSVTNFIYADAGRDAREVCNMLLARGFLIKPIHSTWIRISVGTADQNAELSRSLAQVLSKAHSPSLATLAAAKPEPSAVRSML